MEAMATQTKHELVRFDASAGSIESLYIGGGTPSTITPQQYTRIFDIISTYLRNDAEVTVEANPNSATPDWLRGMRDLGVNRISFGVQSFDDAKLKKLGRAHSSAQAIKAVETASHIGYDHISVDLIYNLQNDTPKLLLDDISQAMHLPIDHISAYELTIEPHTMFATTPQIRQEDDELAFLVADTITSMGFEHYEISNFGRYQSHHNIGYWQQKNYMGIGAGAVGYLHDTRYYPPTDIRQYIDTPLNIQTEHLSTDELLTEMVFLGMRSNVGIATHKLPPHMLAKAQELISYGKLRQDGDCIYNVDFFLADEVALYLLDE